MLRLIGIRLATGVVTLFLAAFFVFFAVQALPGDVAQQLLGQNATPEAVATLRAQLGLDTNVWVRFFQWLGHAITGDFGTSLVSGEPVSAEIWAAFSHTLLIAVPAIVVGITLSVLHGILAGARRGTAIDSSISVLSLIMMSIPEFVVATLLILLLAIIVPIFPAVVLEGPDATLGDLLPAVPLPAVTLIIAMAAYIIRAMRSSTIDGLTTEYATTATLKGVPHKQVLWRHVTPTALLPVLPVISINVAWLLGGVVVVESVFNYPGLGKLMIDSVSTRDLPVLQAIAVLSALVYVMVNLIADLLALAVDPRQRTLHQPRLRRETKEVAA
ncbi:putative ABC transporter permease protein [Microlunatus phosphovorus NM-1]|uniref:Putative ABC transporter permease protein n=1 Tax=Microlunatus phosphovorus (strain ATCC 700054 / DSM 10555 / JCM 9379 / NBRC 101784 / NCIMB 13414 / VKM Ac-1990 / NM-1) TaxID=1032480 RepID=F5XLJ4_MICPN|nr:ABC transporter permease [Microlunatus phosphovorus]BAK36260.1 putative ABC transporter permease protein [Microlunatus phosphovorus NM-1]